ncbi:MAG: zinc ribbon domain-containing protein [Nitrospira sp.]|nr:zinc ribbon domain-containing protein [Nitrospira sp.]
MPIYEYKCTICGEDFEKLVFGNQEVSCPQCSSQEIKKKFSVFCATGTQKPLAGTGAACTSCSKTSCSSCG